MNLASELKNQSNLKTDTRAKIWAIGGGKGGVGKSLVSANTSICLALMGHKVIAVDLDLGGANMHTCLGINIPQKTLSDYLQKKVDRIEDLLVETPIRNLQIISGAQDELGIANLKQMHKSKLLSKLNQLDADFVILDLGAGTSYNTLDFFIAADKGILVILPEPTSIENTYRFIKAVYYRRLKMIEDLLEIQPIIDQAMNSKITGQATPPMEMVKKIKEQDPEMGERLEHELARFRPKIIMNQVRSQQDIDIGFSIQNVCKRYFGLNIDYTGYLDYDSSVWQSVKKRRPLLMEFPNSRLVGNFDRIVHRLLGLNQ